MWRFLKSLSKQSTSTINKMKGKSKQYICSAQSRNRYNSEIVLRNVGILTLLRKVGILTLRKTIPELSLRKVRIGTK